jgi:hypothetical protein
MMIMKTAPVGPSNQGWMLMQQECSNWFWELKQHLWGCKYCNSEEELAIHEWLRMQEPDLYHDEILTLKPGWQKCNIMLSDCGEKQRYVSGLNELHNMIQQFLITFLLCGEPDLMKSLDICK